MANIDREKIVILKSPCELHCLMPQRTYCADTGWKCEAFYRYAQDGTFDPETVNRTMTDKQNAKVKRGEIKP